MKLFAVVLTFLLSAATAFSQDTLYHFNHILIENKPFFGCAENPFHGFHLKLSAHDWEQGNYDAEKLLKQFTIAFAKGKTNGSFVFRMQNGDIVSDSETFYLITYDKKTLTYGLMLHKADFGFGQPATGCTRATHKYYLMIKENRGYLYIDNTDVGANLILSFDRVE